MKILKPSLRTLVIPGMLFLGACCCSKDVVVAPQPVPVPAPAPVPAPPPAPVKPPTPAPVIIPPLADIFFDFDKADIRSDAAAQLRDDAEWMKANPTKRIILEAHTDVKGSSPYNLALGQRRATAAMNYLIQLGINPARLKAVNYGKDKPVVQGTSDEVRAQNRRVCFIVE
ncbi:MAG: OmpA family protein [Chlorobium sp.]